MQRSLWLGVLFVLLFTLPPGAIAGETQDRDDVLVDATVVTASRFEQRNEKAPAQVTVITAKDIRESGAQSVPDALRNLGGVIVSDLNGNGFNQTVDMGGFGETSDRHVAVLVNGRKINPIDLSGISFLSIPVENVDKIEVLHGGSSVLYGGDAMGGVINIITKEPQKGVHVSGEAGAGSNGTLKGQAGVSFTSGSFGGSAGVVYYDTDGYRDRSEADRQSANAKLTFDPSDVLGVSFEASTTRADYQYPGSLTLSQMESDREQAVNLADEGESRDDAYVLSVRSDLGKFGLFNVDLSCRNYESQETMVSWNTPSWGSYGYYDYDSTTLGANPQYVLDRAFFGRDNRLTLGLEYYDTDYEAWNGDTTAKTPIQSYDHDQTTAGFYAQDEFSITDFLVMNLGARYEKFDTTLRSGLAADNDIDEDEWAWNLGLSYIFAPKSKIYVRTYQAFRFPKADEFMILSSGAVNTELEHETSKGYEAGIRFVGMGDRLTTNFRVFTFDVDNEITWNNATYQNENLDETRHQGAEFDIDFKATDLVSLFGGFGYTNAELTSGANDGKKIPLVPEFKANLGFILNFDFGLTFRCQYNHLGERYAGGDSSNVYDKLDSADTVDLYLSYPYKKVEFFLNATNIFNEEYYNGYNYGPGYESYYPMAEAVYYGGIRMMF